MAELCVELLGPPRVRVDGTPLDVDTRKAIALLARLVVTGSERREALTALLWPESDESRGRAALRRTLSALNVGLGHRWLDADRDEVRLHGDELWSDVAAFERSRSGIREHGHEPTAGCPTCLESLEEAVALYRGRFLAGFTLRDSPAFDDWCATEGARLQRQACVALDRLVEIQTRRGSLDLALANARRRLEVEPLHEPTHRWLMLLHAWGGQRDRAMRQYRECVRVLEEELGVPPLARTTELHEAIVSGHVPEPPPPAPVRHDGVRRPRAPRPHQPLVGRGPDLDRLRTAHAAAGREGHLVAVEGEPGVGKTRLVAELVEDARAGGAPTVTISCYQGEQPIAYGVTAELLRAAAATGAQRLGAVPEAWLREAARLVPELVTQRPDLAAAGPLESLEGPESRRRFLEALRQVIAGCLAGPTPAVVVIDDVHWADEASQDVLAYLLRRLEDLPMCVVLTWRTELLALGHPLRRLVRELVTEGRGTHLELDRLGPDELVRLAEAMGVEAQDEVGRQLASESEGLPLFAVEYLRAIRGESGADPERIPAGIREVVEERLGRVSDTARQILSAAAVIGRSFDVDTLLEASGRDPAETVDALEELTTADVVSEVGGEPPRYDFRHDKLRVIAYEETSAARRRLLHDRVADALSARRRRHAPPPAGTVARHLRLAGRQEQAAHAHADAAEEALALSAHVEALEHLRAALDLGHPGPGSLHARRGDLLTLRGDYTDALHAYSAAAAHARDPEELARLEHRTALVHDRRGDWAAAEAHVEAGLAALPATGAASLRARLHTDRSLLAHRRDEHELAASEARRALELATEAEEEVVRAQALNLLGMLARSRGRADAAVTHLEQSLDIAEEFADLGPRVAALNNLALAHADRGETPEGLELAKQALALSRRQGDRHREAAILNNLGDLLHGSGRRDEALGYVKRAVAVFSEVGEPDGHEPEIWKLVDW